MSNKANKGSFRIISGKYKGRKFEFLPSKDLRPTPDRLRETLFNWLGQVIDQKTCLDLFSGTGSLGLESLSRGAHKVTFVEKNFEHFDKLKSYIEKLNATEEISIINNFLPKQMSDEETRNICKKVIENLQAKSIKDMGKVMGTIKKEYGDVLDFSKVSNFIKEFLK